MLTANHPETGQAPAFYNDLDAHACRWLENLIDAGELSPGIVRQGDFRGIDSSDLLGYGHHHWFAGIGGWALALRLAGWPADRRIWSASLPCQPLSIAGKKRGKADPRYVWPDFRRLVADQRPPTIIGEQVGSPDGREWLAGVRVDLVKLGYAVGAADLPAAGVAAPHPRQRLFWVADSGGPERNRGTEPGREHGRAVHPANRCGVGDMADAGQQSPRHALTGSGLGSNTEPLGRGPETLGEPGRRGGPGGLGHAVSAGILHQGRSPFAGAPSRVQRTNGERKRLRANAREYGNDGESPWSRSVVIPCGDGKSRRLKPGLECLVNGVPYRLADGRAGEDQSRPALLRGFGNAIVPELAAVFIRAYMAVRGITPC